MLPATTQDRSVSAYAYTPWIWPLLGSALLQVGLAAYLWRRRQTRAAIPLALVMVLSALWCITDAGELAATAVAIKEHWFLARDALVLPGMTAALWFVIEYVGLERWLTRPVVAVLVGVIVLLIPFYLVDDARLLFARLWWDGEVEADFAPLGVAFAAYGYSIAVLGTALLAMLFVRSPAHRVPVALIILGQLGVRVAYPLGVLNVAEVPSLASMTVAVDFASLMYVIALFRFRLFDLVPVARESIFATMPDALLVLDTNDRIAEANQAALTWLQTNRGDLLGRPASNALAAYPELLRSLHEPEAGPLEVSLDAAGIHAAEVSRTPLRDWQDRPIGRLLLLHDISALRRVELQLVDRERALAGAQERERLARELHDGLAQDLWLAKLKATRLASQPELGPEARALTEEVTAAVDAGIAEAREAVAAMRLVGEEGTPLRELLARVLDDFEDRFGLGVDFDCEDELPSLSARIEAEILRIAQEALTNVRRHADATLVRVVATVNDGQVTLEIRDNGRGFQLDSVGESPYGLAGMRERATLVGGVLEIESAPRQGTSVRLVVPCGSGTHKGAAQPATAVGAG